MGHYKIVMLRKRKLMYLALILIIICILGLRLSMGSIQTTLSGKIGNPTVVLDPGHGGVDSGAIFEKVMEKDITLDITLRIKSLLEEKNISFALTRDSDVDLGGELTSGRHKRDLLARREVINRGKLAISIHVNTTKDNQEKGAVVFYAKGSENGKHLAESILTELSKVQDLNYLEPIPRTNLFLLRTSLPPMVLVELGFISNRDDRTKLMQTDFRQKCAQAVTNGIEKYLRANKDN